MARAETHALTANFPVSMVEKVDQMADRLEPQRGWIKKQALASCIALEEERDRLTREALADVDAGRVIDHRMVQSWADRLVADEPLAVPADGA